VIYKLALLSSKVGCLPCNITNVIIIKHQNSVLASTLLREKVMYTFNIFCLEKQNPSKIPNFSKARISNIIFYVVVHKDITLTSTLMTHTFSTIYCCYVMFLFIIATNS